VLPNITGDQPSSVVDINRWKHIKNLNLADPEFNRPHHIDMLLGGDVYATLLRPGVLLGTNSGEPTAINTIFGWVINGPVDSRVPSVVSTHCTIMESEPLEVTLKRRSLPQLELCGAQLFSFISTYAPSMKAFVVLLP
jgi:hypothetical protein